MSDGPENKDEPRADNTHPGAPAHRRTVGPAIPRQVASPQSLTPLHRTSQLYSFTENEATPLDTFRGSYPDLLDKHRSKPAASCSLLYRVAVAVMSTR